MKLETKRTELHQNTDSQTFEVGTYLESKALQFKLIMDKLYTNPLRATIREIISNAIDANREAESENKIDITLPGIESCLWIRDYGIGINPERMQKYYTKVFTSSKREDNTGIGSYGIGRLSCLSLAEQYPLITRVNGAKYHYAVYLNEFGIPDISLLLQEKTEEANGTSVGIPTTDIDKVKEYLVETLAFTDVNVNCEDLNEIILNEQQSKLLETKDWYHKLKSNRSMVIEIGGVPYNIPKKINESIEKEYFDYFGVGRCLSSAFEENNDSQINFIPTFRESNNLEEAGVVLRIPIGELDISSSREYLQDTENNREIIRKQINKLSNELPFKFETYVQQTNLVELSENVKVASELQDYFKIKSVSINNKQISHLGKPSQLLDWKKTIPLVIDYMNEQQKSKVYISPKKGEKIGTETYDGKRLVKVNKLKVYRTGLKSLIESKVILHESSKRGKEEYYYKQVSNFEENDVLVYLIEDLDENNWRNEYPVLAFLETLGLEVITIKRKQNNKKYNNSSTKKDNTPIHKYIRPVLEYIEGSQWSDMFSKTPVREMPKEGLYVTVESPRLQIELTLLKMTKEERNKVYFVKVSQVHNLPDSFVELEDYLVNRRLERSAEENYLLDSSYNNTGQEKRVKELFNNFKDSLNPKAKSFFENFEEEKRHYIQEITIRELWNRLTVPTVTNEKISTYLFNPNFLSKEAQSLLVYLMFKGREEYIKYMSNLIKSQSHAFAK